MAITGASQRQHRPAPAQGMPAPAQGQPAPSAANQNVGAGGWMQAHLNSKVSGMVLSRWGSGIKCPIVDYGIWEFSDQDPGITTMIL